MPVGSGSRGPVTEEVQSQFFGIITGELNDKWNWLTPVSLAEPVGA